MSEYLLKLKGKKSVLGLALASVSDVLGKLEVILDGRVNKTNKINLNLESDFSGFYPWRLFSPSRF